MRDFDVARSARADGDRKFKIGGETFTRKVSVRPEALQEWEDVKLLDTNDTPQQEFLGILDRTITSLIEPGARSEAHKRWGKLREREDDPITGQDMLDLIPWLIGEMAGRPTVPPVNFSDVPETTGTTSTDGS